MTFGRLAFILLLGAFAVPLPTAEAQTPVAQYMVKVSTQIVPPFVMREVRGNLTGFSTDLWNAIARDIGVTTEFVVADNVQGILSDVASGNTDLGIAAISITAEREKTFDFSQPVFNSGLRVAVAAQPTPGASAIDNLLSFIESKALLELLAVILVLVLMPVPLLWLSERKAGTDLLQAKTKIGQFGQALWWSISALSGQAQDMPSGIVGRIVAMPYLLLAVLFASYFTATVTTRMTITQIERGTTGPNDLGGRWIATVTGSTAATWLKSQRIAATEYSDVDVALDAVETGKAHAIVFDEPVLAYFAAGTRKARVRLSGPVFQSQHYGIAFLPTYSRRRAIDQALLHLKETGEYQRIQAKWFGDAEQ